MILKQNQWKACGATVRQTCWVSVTSDLCDWLNPVIEALTSDSDVWASADLRFPLRPCEGDKHSQILLLPQTHHSEHTSLLLPQISVSQCRDLSERRSGVFKHTCSVQLKEMNKYNVSHVLLWGKVERLLWINQSKEMWFSLNVRV